MVIESSLILSLSNLPICPIQGDSHRNQTLRKTTEHVILRKKVYINYALKGRDTPLKE